MSPGDDLAGRQAWLRRHGPGGPTGARRGGAGAAPADGLVAHDLPGPGADWVPLGPTQATGGGAGGRPSVTGRILGLAIGAGGARGYAATASGGVWMTLDSGARWTALDPWRDTPNAALVSNGGGLAIGSVAARFGTTADDDIVFAGCGGDRRETGDGVRRYGRAGPGLAPVWSNEATNVTAQATWRVIAAAPTAAGGPERAWLASSQGLFERPAAAPFGVWTPIVLPAGFAVQQVTDVALLLDAGVEYLFAAVQGAGVVRFTLAGGSAAGVAGTPCLGFAGTLSALNFGALGRISLAAAEDGAPRVYALIHIARGTQRARLLRLLNSAPGTPTFRHSTGIPGDLSFKGSADQGESNDTVAIVPQAVPPPATATDEVVIAGSFFVIEGENQASLYRVRMAGTAAAPAGTATYAGQGAHADVHFATFARRADGTADRDDLWIGTDGGVFRSQAAVEAGRFQPAHGGMGVFEVTFLADHPAVPALLLAGTQDNGMLVHSGEPTWQRQPWAGDAGGVAIDPSQPRWMWQYTTGTLFADRAPAARLPAPQVRFPTTAVVARQTAESGITNFYAPIRSISLAPGGRVAFASHRVWTSDDWGAHWVSWPSGTNPAAAAGGFTTDQLDGGSVVALAWAAPQVLVAATGSGVYRLRGIGTVPGAGDVLARDVGTANRGLRRPGEAAVGVPPAFATVGAPGGVATDLPNGFQPSAVAPADPAASAVYLGLGAGPEPVWFLPAGAANWQSAGLGAFLGGSTSVHSVLVDPAHPEDVYAGTDVGVYRGVHNAAAVPPWAWQDFSFGLPEASVSDLALFAPAGGPRLLRAATFGRGVWEIDLEKATGRDATPPRSPELFVRVSATDDGRRITGITRLPDPLDPTLPTPPPSGIAASPDIAIVRGRARVVLPWPGAVTGAAHNADRQAWRIAASTWGTPLTPSTAAFGNADRNVWQAIQRERMIPVTTALNERTWRTTFSGLDRDPDHVRYISRFGRELGPSGRQAADFGPNRLLVHVRTRGPGALSLPATLYVLFQLVVAAPVVATPAPSPPHPGVTLPNLPADWRRSVIDHTDAALAAGGWQLAGGGTISVDPMDPEVPGVVGVDIDFTGRAVGDLIAIVAILHSVEDPLPDQPAAVVDLPTVLSTESRVAMRVVEVRDPAT